MKEFLTLVVFEQRLRPKVAVSNSIDGLTYSIHGKTKFTDLVQIPPHEGYKPQRHELEDKINEKYANKVVQNVGLCVCLWDLTKASDGLIGHGTGNLNVHVEFQMIVFRPFKGEIIAGVVGDSSPEGLQISTNFFQDIFVPSSMLFEGTEYVTEEKTWLWRTEESEIYLDKGIKVHVRVENEKFQDLTPRGPSSSSTNSTTAGDESAERRKLNAGAVNGGNENGNGNGDETDGDDGRVSYSIEASMAEPGLGGVDWW